MRKTNRFAFVFAMLLVVLFAASSILSPGALAASSGTTGAADAAGTAGTYKIAALGDSVTAGFEPQALSDPKFVPYGYVDRLKEQGLYHGRTEVANYGILGLTSEGLANYAAAVKEGLPVKPDDIQSGLNDPRIADLAAGTAKAKSDLEAANVIVLTIGGNDVRPLLEDYAVLSGSELASKAQTLLADYQANAKQALSDLRSLNPNALIVLADQYQPVPKLANAAAYAALEQVAGQYTAAVDSLVAELQAQGPIKAAHVAAAFTGYELSYTHIMEKDIHPNQAGYEEMAKVFATAIWGEYRVTAAKQGLADISIVVKGKELNTGNAPILKNGQTFVAIGDIVSAVGADAKWDSKTQTATIAFGGRVVKIPVGAKAITVDGVSLPTSSPAFLNKVGLNSKTYVPLALLSKGLGFDVQYAGKIKTAFINL